MAVIQTDKGRVIGLVVTNDQPEAKPIEEPEEDIFGNEQQKRGRPKKQ